MPAYLTHRAAGERVLEQLDSNMVPNRNAYLLGCQGPDILYFRNYYPWRSAKETLRLGIDMHDKYVRALFNKAFEFVRTYGKEDKDELTSYFLGFITHYAIDKNAHPFVYQRAGDDNNLHHAIEFMWDSYTSKEQWNIEPKQFDISADVMYGDVGDGICEWYCNIAKHVYQINIKPYMIREAQKHLAKAKKALNNITLPAKMLIKAINKVVGFDLSNMTYPEKRDFLVFTKEEYDNMRKTLDTGVDEAAKMIHIALNVIHQDNKKALLPWFGDKDFSGNTINA